jgi:hypothetical protein
MDLSFLIRPLMNRLPQVLQNEIWEYVRGDRAYWKQQFSSLVNQFFPAVRDIIPQYTIGAIKSVNVFRAGQHVPGLDVSFYLDFETDSVKFDMYDGIFQIKEIEARTFVETQDIDDAIEIFLTICRQVAVASFD